MKCFFCGSHMIKPSIYIEDNAQDGHIEIPIINNVDYLYCPNKRCEQTAYGQDKDVGEIYTIASIDFYKQFEYLAQKNRHQAIIKLLSNSDNINDQLLTLSEVGKLIGKSVQYLSAYSRRYVWFNYIEIKKHIYWYKPSVLQYIETGKGKLNLFPMEKTNVEYY